MRYYMSFQILGTGSFLPQRVVTNEELSQMVETSDQWITQRVGVKTRHVCTSETALDLGAAEIAMLLGVLLLLFLFDLADEKTDAIAMVSRWPAVIRWACYLGLVLIVLVFGIYGPGYDVRAFAYFAF